MNQTKTHSESLLVYTTRKCQHRTWMNGCTFTMNKKNYVILEGGWEDKDGQIVDVIKFAEVGGTTKYSMSEKEFFSKVNKQNLRLP